MNLVKEEGRFLGVWTLHIVETIHGQKEPEDNLEGVKSASAAPDELTHEVLSNIGEEL